MTSNKKLQLENALEQWFSDECEAWMNMNATKSDRRHMQESRNNSGSNAVKNRRNADRRKNPRFKVELPVDSVETIQESFLDVSKTSRLMGTSENYFKSKVPLKESSLIKIVMDCSKMGKNFESIVADAVVVRTSQLSSGEYGINILISNINVKEKENLNAQILKSLAFQKSDIYSLFVY